MDKELWVGLVEHIKKNGEESRELETLVSKSVTVSVGNREIKLSLHGVTHLLGDIHNIVYGHTDWDDHISVNDVNNSTTIGRLYDYGFTTLIKPYDYLNKQLSDIVGIMKVDYQRYEYRKEQEKLKRRSQEELREEKVQNFLYGE